jgi:prepilin-type N-terminal cleavage/methylation domain-containing protein
MKKAFTLFEVLVAMLIIVIISTYAYKEKVKIDFHTDVTEFISYMDVLIKTGVNSNVTGFPRGDGDVTLPCSNDNSFTGITAARVFGCNGMKGGGNYVQLIATISTGPDDTLGQNHYAHDYLFLGNQVETGCHIQFNSGSTPSEYLLFVDCSNLLYAGGNPRYLQYIEDRLEKLFDDMIGVNTVVYRNELTMQSFIPPAVGAGSNDDGMIGFVIQP